MSGKWSFMVNNSHLNLKDYVSDINRKREGSNRHIYDITVRIFKIATGRLPDKYEGCQILRQTRLKKRYGAYLTSSMLFLIIFPHRG